MSGSEGEQFCLKWNDFQQCIKTTFQELRDQADFMDVTLSCDGEQIRAHKVILSACSVTFRQLLKANPAPNPVILLWDVSLRDLASVLDFMYNGEVNVKQEHLNSFLAVAERLRVRGLCQNDGNRGAGDNSASRTKTASRHHSSATESPAGGSLSSVSEKAGGSSSNSLSQHHNNSAKRLKYDPAIAISESANDEDSDGGPTRGVPPPASTIVKQERVEDLATAAVSSISQQLAARFTAAAAAHAVAAANASAAVAAAAAAAAPSNQQMLVAGSADYSEAYGGDGDYEEYYDEDVSYGAGDPASAGKGDRSAAAVVAAAMRRREEAIAERSSRSESPLSLSASPKLEIITGLGNVLSAGSLSPSIRDSMRQRTVYSPAQILELEKEFQFSHFLTGERRSSLAQQLRLTDRQVKIWFQNRRMKLKKEVKEGRLGFPPQL